MPSKPVMVHELGATMNRVLKLARAELIDLGVDWHRYGEINNERTQLIGAATARLKLDGLIAPSARWECDNVMLFAPDAEWAGALTLLNSAEVDWLAWAKSHRRG